MLDGCFDFLKDDLNTAQTLANLFELSNRINSFYHDQISVDSISEKTLEKLKSNFKLIVEDILGLESEAVQVADISDDLMGVIIGLRQQAKDNKDYQTSDKIRDELQRLHIELKDNKDGTVDWKLDS